MSCTLTETEVQTALAGLIAENDALDAALADEMRRHQALLGICRDVATAYGNNGVDFHRAIARLRQHLGES